jgi:ribosomal protein S19
MRSLWKGVFSKYKPQAAQVDRPVIYSRSSTIESFWLGKRVLVYNGYRFVSLLIKPFYIGRKFGEFVTTKRTGPRIHMTKRNRKKAIRR